MTVNEMQKSQSIWLAMGAIVKPRLIWPAQTVAQADLLTGLLPKNSPARGYSPAGFDRLSAWL